MAKRKTDAKMVAKSILVGLGDLEYSQSATEHAVELSKRFDARVTAVTLFDPDTLSIGPVPIGAGEAAKELREHRVELTQEVLAEAVDYFIKNCESAGICYDVLHETGNALEKIIACSRYHDLVVCGLRNLFAHGVTQDPPYELVQLVEAGVRPVLAVAQQYTDIRRVLIAYSGSIESSKAMKQFVQMNLWPDAELRIVTFDSNENIGKQRLDNAAEYCRQHGLEPEIEYVNKSAASSLPVYATGWGADLIVMGNSAKTYLLRRIFGEIVLNLVSEAKHPLFLSQ